MAGALQTLTSRQVSVITNDGRHLVGTLRGTDQTTNLVLDECQERVYTPGTGVEVVPLGLYIIRGDNIAVVGEVDEKKDAELDLGTIQAPPLKAVVH